MAKAFATLFIIFLFFASFIIYRTGYLKDVKIASGYQGPFILVYKLHKGPYHKISQVITEVEDELRKLKIDCPLAFGRYLHDPNLVDHDRLESHGGCALPAPNEKLKELPDTWKVEVLEKKEYVVATFDGSPSMGPIKVYPMVQKWLEKYGYKQQGPVIELYQTLSEDQVLTRYLFGYQ